MIFFDGLYYDGKSSKAHFVRVSVDPSRLQIHNDALNLSLPLSHIELFPPVGSSRTVIRLGSDGEIHTQEVEAIEELETLIGRRRGEAIAGRLEKKIAYAIGALILTVALVAAFLRYGLPVIARYTAAILPEKVGESMGKETLSTLEELYLDPTALPATRQNRLRNALSDACRNTQCPPYRLLFRNSAALGANAFALPGHTIVITDQLIEKAHHDEELVAVLSHELGHVKYDHIDRMLLQSLGSGLVLVMITGEISNFSDMAAGLPALLLQQGYSRDMEDEADRFALELLTSAGIPPKRFADILLRITKEAPSGGTLFSSHPDTAERIAPFIGTR